MLTSAFAGVSCSVPFNLTNGTTADASQVMANYNAILACLANSTAASGANNDITSLSGLTTPLSPGQGGTTSFIGVAGSSTGTTQVVSSTTPTAFALAAGYQVYYVASATNTGASTLAVDGLAATNIFKQSVGGPVALSGGEIQAGNVVAISFDGTQFQLNNPVATNLAPCSAIGLQVFNDAGTPNTKIDVLADAVTILSASAPIYRTAVSVVINATVNGANGLDTGSLAISTWYNVFLIDNGTAVAGLASLSATAPTMPSGYTFKCRVGAMNTVNPANFERTIQLGAHTVLNIVAASNTPNFPNVSNGTAGTSCGSPTPGWANTSIALEVPPTATSADVLITNKYNAQASSDVVVSSNSAAGGLSSTNTPLGGMDNTAQVAMSVTVPLTTAQQVAYCSSGSGGALYVTGWKDKVNAN